MNENNELLVIYRKGSDMSFPISNIFESRNMRNGLINRTFIIDTIGDYNVIYSMDTDIENIMDLLKKECMGEVTKDVDRNTNAQVPEMADEKLADVEI